MVKVVNLLKVELLSSESYFSRAYRSLFSSLFMLLIAFYSLSLSLFKPSRSIVAFAWTVFSSESKA